MRGSPDIKISDGQIYNRHQLIIFGKTKPLSRGINVTIDE